VAIRLCPVPDNAPPYDDETPGAVDDGPARPEVFVAALTAALDRSPDKKRGVRPAGAAAAGPGEGAPGPGEAAPGPREAAPGPGEAAPGPREAAPGPGDWPSAFAQVLAETLAGSRPPAQMTRWTTERTRSHIRRLGPLLAAGAQPRVRRVVTSRPAAGVVEMAVVVGFGPRVRALAVRLERSEPRPAACGLPDGRPRWVCTAVEAA
jgi:hypothetical protein